MRTPSIGQQRNNLEMYFLAGLATAPGFMDNVRIAMEARLRKEPLRSRLGAGGTMRSELLYPYGDRSRSPLIQMWEIRADMRLRADRTERSIGGRRALEAILGSRPDSGSRVAATLLVGHSGGGVAAVHAADQLLSRGLSASCAVVKIGSPRCRIPQRLRSRVLAIRAQARADGRSSGRSPDIVPRLGSYGGWARGRRISWSRDLHAPGARLEVPILGKHADYFRDRAPFLNAEGKSNLDLILDAIADWLYRLNR
ncbi:hypothetical protein ACF3MZ_13880 [Paenibacillaceae bacterium WGS1546]|uniref:hypothetical protein n=1 Tax=Cohnella sp. WGS1546 TaxID=3366810 RepID=UPI00372D5A76